MIFFNSNFFVGLITLIVGGVAIFIYIKQKRDQKRDAANIILMEIRYAEKLIERFTAGGIVMDLQNKIIPTNNWYKYNYLFVQDLDIDEIDQLNNFYNQCSLIDKSIEQLNINKQLEQKSQAIHQVLIQLAKESIGNEAVYVLNRDVFLNIVNREIYVFRPDAPTKTIDNAMANIRFIMTSTVGAKLKNIAGIK